MCHAVGTVLHRLSEKSFFWHLLLYLQYYYWGNHKNQQLGGDLQKIYSEAENSVVSVADESSAAEVWTLKEGAKKLLERNSDVIGYINIPDTVISYPVVQRRKEDGNEYYMDKNIDLQEEKAGTIFLDWRNYFDYVVDGVKVLDNSANLVIYGHDMKDRSMFGSLQDYMDVDGFYSEHPIIELSSNYKTYQYKIFAYFIVDADDETETKFDCWNTLDFNGEDDFYEYVNNARKRALTLNNVDVRYGDQLLTLLEKVLAPEEEAPEAWHASSICRIRWELPGESGWMEECSNEKETQCPR